MSEVSSNNATSHRRRMPGRGFLKNFFKVHGPVRTLKGTYFYYYSQLKFRRLSLDKSTNQIVTVNDYRMVIIPTDKGISAELAIFNVHEPLTTKLLLSRIRPGMVCLDIGSNIGYYALLESRLVGKEGRVICVEPSPLNYQYLQKNLEMEGRSHIDKYNLAVGDVDGQTSFLNNSQSNLSRVIGEKNNYSSSNSTEENNDDYINANKLIKVPIKRVDTLISELAPKNLDFVRMDPEGYEASIYQGMRSTVRKYKPALLIEFHKNYLGIAGTRKLIQDLVNDDYESLFYIPRWMDNPIIASEKYVEEMTLRNLLEKLDGDSLPAGFSLFLVNNKLKGSTIQ